MSTTWHCICNFYMGSLHKLPANNQILGLDCHACTQQGGASPSAPLPTASGGVIRASPSTRLVRNAGRAVSAPVNYHPQLAVLATQNRCRCTVHEPAHIYAYASCAVCEGSLVMHSLPHFQV